MATRSTIYQIPDKNMVNYNYCDDLTFVNLESKNEILEKSLLPHGQKIGITKISLLNDIKSNFIPIMILSPKVLL